MNKEGPLSLHRGSHLLDDVVRQNIGAEPFGDVFAYAPVVIEARLPIARGLRTLRLYPAGRAGFALEALDELPRRLALLADLRSQVREGALALLPATHPVSSKHRPPPGSAS